MLGPGRTPNHPPASARTPHDGPRVPHPPSPLHPGRRPPSPRPSWCWNPVTKPAQKLAGRLPAAPPLRPHEPLPPSTSTPRGDSKGVRFKGGGDSTRGLQPVASCAAGGCTAPKGIVKKGPGRNTHSASPPCRRGHPIAGPGSNPTALQRHPQWHTLRMKQMKERRPGRQ